MAQPEYPRTAQPEVAAQDVQWSLEKVRSGSIYATGGLPESGPDPVFRSRVAGYQLLGSDH